MDTLKGNRTVLFQQRPNRLVGAFKRGLVALDGALAQSPDITRGRMGLLRFQCRDKLLQIRFHAAVDFDLPVTRRVTRADTPTVAPSPTSHHGGRTREISFTGGGPGLVLRSTRHADLAKWPGRLKSREARLAPEKLYARRRPRHLAQ